jgi:hypothetical protein
VNRLVVKITVDCDDDFLIAGKNNYRGKFESFEALLEFMQQNVTTKYSKIRAYDCLLDCKTHRDRGDEPAENKAHHAIWWLTVMLPTQLAILADRIASGERRCGVAFGGNHETTIEWSAK